METSNENMRQLLEMLDHPEAYTDQEIQDIILRDKDMRETYRLMVDIKRSSRHRQHHDFDDVDAAWQRLSQEFQPKHQHFGWIKMAASFIGILLISGIAFATIHLMQQHQKPKTPQTEMTESMTKSATTTPSDTLACDTTALQPVIFDNIPLEEMLPKIADKYGVEVVFQNNEVRNLRFRFVWNPQHDISQVVSDLNQFNCLNVTQKGHQIIVDGLLTPNEK